MRLRLLGILMALGCALASASSARAQCCAGPYVHGEYLFMRARHTALPYAANRGPNGAGFLGDDLQQTQFDRDHGFSVGVGYLMSECWDVDFTYTYFNNSGFDGQGDPTIDGNNVVPLNPGPLGVVGVMDAASQILSMDYQTFDLAIGRYFRPADGLTLRVTGGIRGAQVNTDSHILYFNINPAFNIDSISDQINFDGIGPRLGGEANLSIGESGFSVVGKTAVSLLLGDFNVTSAGQFSQIAAGGLGVGGNIASAKFEYEQLVPILDMRLGTRYDFGPCYVSTGYQFSSWFGYFSPLGTNLNGNLFFDGIYVEAGAIW